MRRLTPSMLNASARPASARPASALPAAVLVCGLLLAGISAPMAWAHDMWLTPSDFLPTVDSAVAVTLEIGHGGGGDVDTVARDPRRIVRLAAIGPDGERPLVGVAGQSPVGYFRPREAGCTTLVFESTAAYSELGAENFEAYLEEEGLDAVQAARVASGARGEPGRELYSRSLKSLVATGDGACDDRVTGLPLEFVLEGGADATELRLLWHGEPIADVLVDLVRLDSPGQPGRARARRSSASGTIRLDLETGVWLATAVHAEPAVGADATRAEWRTVFASLTFRSDRPAGVESPRDRAESR